jgi:Putative addiction module component
VIRVRSATFCALEYLLVVAKTLEKLAEEAMSLPTESRARLADLRVESLDADELGHIDRLWLAEAKRRRDEIRTGRVEAVP